MRDQRFGLLVLAGLMALGLASGLTLMSVRAKETAVSTIVPLSSATIQQTKPDENGLQFTLQTPKLTTSNINTVHVAGLNAQMQEPGAPALPYYATFIALPPEATASIHVDALNISTRFVNTVLAVPQSVDRVEDGKDVAVATAVSTLPDFSFAQPPALVNTLDPAIYQQDALYPAAAYTVSEPMYYRDLRLVELRLYPVRYNPVTQELQQAQLAVAITFEGVQTGNSWSAPVTDDRSLHALSNAILNYDQALNWRSLPQELINFPAAAFPADAAETYKIEVNQDGIYEISGAELAAAGMDIGSVDPAAIQMMVRNQSVPTQTLSVATQFIGDSDTILESDEKFRFYGWAFDGPRTEKQFISNNVFWLWAGGTPTTIVTTTNPTGGTAVTSTMTAVTKEPKNLFTTGYTDQWDAFPNDPDGWYWDYVRQGSTNPLTKTYQISLTHPAATGPDAIYTVEMMPRDMSIGSAPYTYTVRSAINNYASYGEKVWTGKQNINITDTIPLTELAHQTNDVHLVFASSSSNAALYLNRITVEYLRQLIAVNDQLIFSDEAGTNRQFQISGFSEDDPANVLVWNISDRNNPQQVDMNGRITGSGSYTYQIGSDTDDTQFIATTATNTLSPAAISQYIPGSLDPAAGGADWIAISHADFRTQADRLAAHRASFSNLQTWVVDYEDVINQYGYGLPLPSVIRDYLAYALGNWSPAPGYVTLFGAATYNPRNLDCHHTTCPGGLGTWDKDQPTFVVTDLVYKDRFQGLIPSDHTMVLLSGKNDLLPDMAIGRITADTTAEAEAVVSKIILYEQTQMTGADWQRNLLFVADNADKGGNFYQENLVTANNYIPGNYEVIQRFLIEGTITETNELRDDMLNDVNGAGVSILNYRGHGSVTRWAGPSIISSDSASTDFWGNHSKPTVILSADCLDGNFAFPGVAALSKTVLTLQSGGVPVGIAANWSSTGLGLTYEHSLLHRNFYDGLFEQDLLTIGDAVNYAKLIYHQGGWHESEMYSFLLQGDPAMQLFTMRHRNYLPTIQN